jgi:hypothetical protein
MATYQTVADAVGTSDAWGLGAGSTKFQAINDDDADTSYIATSTNTLVQSFKPTEESYPSMGVINSVSIGTRAKDNNAGSEQHYARVRWNGSVTNGTNRSTTASYVLYTDSSLARPGGGTWTPGNLADGTLEHEVVKNNAGGGSTLITYMYFTFDYIPPADASMWLLTCWLPPLFAAASHAISYSEIAKALECLKIKPSSREEFARIIEGFAVRPRFA